MCLEHLHGDRIHLPDAGQAGEGSGIGGRGGAAAVSRRRARMRGGETAASTNTITRPPGGAYEVHHGADQRGGGIVRSHATRMFPARPADGREAAGLPAPRTEPEIVCVVETD